ncbi:carbon monoxide dehydrogenase subunit G [Microbispora sp. NPDC049125]|uniref:SRPBCC family protein n=1 Tax=Microbispora sp. NPDC049125 TaxID=3154929 RepID=UPI003466DE12
MKVVGSALLGAERKRVWDALQDPAVLVRTIPGCARLEEVGADVYAMTVTAGVASIKGVYQGEVSLTDPDEPERFVLRARGQGAPGTVEASVVVRLSEADGGTRVDYDAEAVVGGMIGGVGQRMLGAVARKTAGEFFSAVERHLLSAGAAPAVDAPAVKAAAGEAAPGMLEAAERTAGVFTRPAPESAPRAARQGVPAWTMLAAFGAGAGVALGSAAIGWVLGRAGTRSGRR